MLSNYKYEVKLINKLAFAANIDYRAKLQALSKFQHKEAAKNKDRKFYIYNIDHDIIKGNKVEFHLKIESREPPQNVSSK